MKDLKQKAGTAAEIAAVMISVLILFIFLHESGHMIVSLGCGAKITEFSVIHARVSSIGGDFPPLNQMIFYANGAFLPYLITNVFILGYRNNVQLRIYHILAFFLSLTAASSLTVWFILPFTYLMQKAPPNDDVTKFLDLFAPHHHPLIVSAAALLLIMISLHLMMKKEIPAHFIKAIRNSKQGRI